MYGPIRNHHLIQNYFTEETQETNLGNQDVDKDMPDIMFDILEAESQTQKENDDVILGNGYVSDDDLVHEDVEINIVVAHGVVVNNHDEKR